ncbi:MAG: hypothetical protein ACOCP1_00995 [Campylobacterales bacterium]
MKIFLISLLCLNSLATEFDFKESRYYDALDFTRVSTGTISYDKNSTTISYNHPIKQDIIISDSSVTVLKDAKRESIDNKNTLLFLKVFEKIIRDENIDRFFKKDGNNLLPKQSALKSTIKSIKKDSNTISIELKNRDRIVFERL